MYSGCLQYLLVIITVMLWVSPLADSTLTPRAPNFQYFERYDCNVLQTEMTHDE